MTIENIADWFSDHPLVFLPVFLILGSLLYRVTRYVLARALYKLAIRTETVYDDLIVDHLRPFRVAWLLPLLLIYVFSYYAFDQDPLISNIMLFLIIWVSVDFSIGLLKGVNEIYKHRPRYTGVSVAAYFDVAKVLIIIAAIVLSISLFVNVPPAVLLSGVGAWLAVLLLIFRDTILSFLASIQISTQELVKDGDWIEVPAYDANGIVSDISLNSITVQNFDNTVTVIPTYKIIDVAYKNWRSMQESGGRRMKRSITLDINSIRFCDLELLERLKTYDVIKDYVNEQIEQQKELQTEEQMPTEFPLDGPQITNVHLFMRYVEAYLKTRRDLHQRRFSMVIRSLEPTPTGLTLEVFAFTRATEWAAFEVTQGEITLHLIAALPFFGLRVHQKPTGMDIIIADDV